MNVMIFGGTGFIGRNLTEELINNGYQVHIVTRNKNNMSTNFKDKVKVIEWDNSKPLSSLNKLEKIDVVVNLAGHSIGSNRWSNSVKQKIIESRIKTTKEIVNAINNQIINPKLLISASAVGYYGPHLNDVIAETEPAGKDFLAEVCKEWEQEAYRVQNDFTRVVTLRIGVVLGNEGALNRMAMPFKFYAGGPVGSGKQWLPWIHVRDLTSIIKFIIEHDEIKGPVNGTAPEPIRIKDFYKVLGEVLNRPSWLPVPGFMLRIALGEMSGMLLNGQRVIPEVLIKSGFKYNFPKIRTALRQIVQEDIRGENL